MSPHGPPRTARAAPKARPPGAHAPDTIVSRRQIYTDRPSRLLDGRADASDEADREAGAAYESNTPQRGARAGQASSEGSLGGRDRGAANRRDAQMALGATM